MGALISRSIGIQALEEMLEMVWNVKGPVEPHREANSTNGSAPPM